MEMTHNNSKMTFTSRLNYSVSEISLEEYMSVVKSRNLSEAKKAKAKKAQESPIPIR